MGKKTKKQVNAKKTHATITAGPTVRVTMAIPENLWTMINEQALKDPMFADHFRTAALTPVTTIPFGFRK